MDFTTGEDLLQLAECYTPSDSEARSRYSLLVGKVKRNPGGILRWTKRKEEEAVADGLRNDERRVVEKEHTKDLGLNYRKET